VEKIRLIHHAGKSENDLSLAFFMGTIFCAQDQIEIKFNLATINYDQKLKKLSPHRFKLLSFTLLLFCKCK